MFLVNLNGLVGHMLSHWTDLMLSKHTCIRPLLTSMVTLLYVDYVYYATRVINAACLLHASLDDVGKMISGKPAFNLRGVSGLLAGFSCAVPVQKGLLYACASLFYSHDW